MLFFFPFLLLFAPWLGGRSTKNATLALTTSTTFIPDFCESWYEGEPNVEHFGFNLAALP